MRRPPHARLRAAFPAHVGLFLALMLASGRALAHDDSPQAHAWAAERGGWDAVTRALAEAEWARDAGDRVATRRWLDIARAPNPSDPRVLALAAQLALDEGRARDADSLASLALTALEAAASAGGWTPARRSLAARLEHALGRAPRPSRPREDAAAVAPPPRPADASRTQAAPDTLVRLGATWRWYAGPAAPPGAWTSLAYADGGWSAGPAPLGYGEARIATTLPDGGVATNRWITSYLRVHFTRGAAAPAAVSATLLADYDDGFVAYLNGTEIARRGLAAGPVGWGTLAANHESGVYEAIALASPGLLQPGDNVLAVELHQQAPNSSDLLWDATLFADTLLAARTRGPYLQNATPNAITARWRTAGAVTGRVSLGPAGGPYTLEFDEPVARTEHEVRLTGLAPETAYAYSVHDALAAPEPPDDARTFRTPPPAGATRPVRLWAIGDSGLNTLAARQVRDAYLAWAGARREDFWLLLGDNAYNAGTDAEYQAGLFDQYPLTLSRSPLWSTRGNHDLLYAGVNNDYFDVFTLPAAGEAGGVPSGTEAWYAFDWGPVHVVCLDSEGSSRALDSPMLEWLRADLAATTQPWVIGFWHHPPYTKGSHDSDDPADSGGRMRDMRERVLPILDSLGVDLVLTGHSHSYERSALLRGHYGVSGTLAAGMFADSGDGRPGGDGAYSKSAGPPRANEGAVYAVNGSAAQVSGGTLDHPAMIASLNVLGSMVIDVDGDRLDARFLDSGGAVRDSFAIVKPGTISVRPSGGPASLALDAPRPSPFTDRTVLGFTLARAARATLAVYDVGGRRVRTLASGPRGPGAHRVTWDGRDGRGARVAPGAYLVVLEAGGERAARRVVRLR